MTIDLASTDFNAGTAHDLDQARTAAHQRATAIREPVDVFQREQTAQAVRNSGAFLWRDRTDAKGKRLPDPRHYVFVETVKP